MQARYKDLIRKAYGSLLYRTGLTWLAYQYRRRQVALTILAYHQMDTTTFEAHLKYLTRYFTIISLREACEMLRGEREWRPSCAVLTFDDGHYSFYRHVFPLLQKYRVPATAFLATDFVGTGRLYWFDRVDAIIDQTRQNRLRIDGAAFHIPASNRLDVKEAIKEHLKQYPEAVKQELINALARQSGVNEAEVPEMARVINWEQAREMLASGLVEIGGHTCSHPILTRIPPDQARREIFESRRILQEMLSTDIHFFAYPNGGPGDFNAEIAGFVRQAGYQAAVTLVEGTCAPGDDLYTLKRISLSDSFTPPALAAKLNGLWK